MKQTGNLLREAREAKGITLQEVSLHLKINTKVLKSIEDGDLQQLPARTFLRGFVQSYGAYLKVDPKTLQDVFLTEMGIAHPGMIIKPEVPEPAPEPPKPVTVEPKKTAVPVEPVAPVLSVDPQTWSKYVKVGLVVFVLVIVALIVGVKRTIEKYEKEASVAEVPNDIQPVSPTNVENTETLSTTSTSILLTTSTSTAVSPTTTQTQTSQLSQSGSTTQSTTSTAKSLPAPLPVNLNPVLSPLPPVKNATVTNTLSTSKTATNTAASATTTSSNTTLAPTATTSATATTTKTDADISSPQEVIIEALDKVNIEYSIDDGAKQSLSLVAEKVHTFKAKKKLTIIVSDGGSINIIHNGKDKGVPGNLGQPLRVTFPNETRSETN